ncbi:MAG: ATP-grasp fold amidoligase family protein [Marinobacter sp.]|uniref:ATP-grasp fold amidoligase family protein n=1 Tax=Marinobacter sp. TaxID=50741 RepID=UPI0034A0669F
MQTISQKLKGLIRNLLSDEIVVDRQFFDAFGRHIDFYNPKTFNEKLQVQKLYVRDSRMTNLADKYEVRQYVKAKGHEAILNHLIAVYDRVEDIDFKDLPNEFVIKCNHSWNTNYICENKSLIDEKKVGALLEEWMRHNHYQKLREWSYKGIKPKIIIERFLRSPLKDFKFFCFSGLPLYIQVDSNRSDKHALDIYDVSWHRLDCRKGNNVQSNSAEGRPIFFEDMLRIAKDLSSDFNFCRVDFLANPDGFYFAEITFYPGGGFSPFAPEEFDYIFGEKFSVACAQIPLKSRLSINAINLLNKLTTSQFKKD